jgi:hypothetical protein
MLGVFTLLAATLANAFWTMPAGAARFMATNAFFEHLGLAGGFVLVALVADRRGDMARRVLPRAAARRAVLATARPGGRRPPKPGRRPR